MGNIKNRDVGQRAWNILRLALLWARKGGIFKRRMVMEMRLLPKYLRRLAHASPSTPHQLYYCERQLSFDKTPIFPRPTSMRFHLPHIPCIKPHVDFDYDFDVDDDEDNNNNNDHDLHLCIQEYGSEGCQQEHENEEEQSGIDVRAEEFIAKFYQQMKLQRQISYLQYHQTQTHTS